MMHPLRNFLRLESSSGQVLFLAALAAIALANSPLAGIYGLLMEMPVEVRVGPLEIVKPLVLWINDGLMAVFFFVVGLELKREIMEGELSEPRQVVLPAVGALGGMLVPAAIFAWINRGDAVALRGWAIPAATDIAFALAILALLGSRVPIALKVFLVSIAIFDDLGAIIVIALFYTSDLSLGASLVALACVSILFVLNRRGVSESMPYLLIGIVMWVAVLKSGVHATLAGVVLAMFIPLANPTRPGHSPLKELEHGMEADVPLLRQIDVILRVHGVAGTDMGDVRG
jgi:NhaA family Na+:H+ antiporter